MPHRMPALVVLALGVAFYLTDRQFPGAGWLPSLAHALGFSLPTAGVLRRACLPWRGLGWLFEIGQHPAIAPTL